MTFEILCPFCSAVFSGSMEEQLTYSAGCPTCGDGDLDGSINIYCTNCKKLIYKKEISINV